MGKPDNHWQPCALINDLYLYIIKFKILVKYIGKKILNCPKQTKVERGFHILELGLYYPLSFTIEHVFGCNKKFYIESQ